MSRVADPQGKPVAEAWAFSRLLLNPQPWPTCRYSPGSYHGDVRDGHFELHGLPPDAEIPVYFLDSKSQLGATALFSASMARKGSIEVKLEPCGSAIARLVDATGKPVAGYRDPYLIGMIATPGPDRLGADPSDKDRLAADQDYLSRMDPNHYSELATEFDGRITFPALIPGATYRIYDRTAQNGNNTRVVRVEFVATSGDPIALGDILIEKPGP